jgi:hypothetical protein
VGRAGGSKANGALEQVFQHLRGITDPVKQAQAATALFGTQAGDLGSALFALDPATAGAAQSIANVDGAASRMDATIAQGIGPRLEMLKRGAQQAATQGMTALINGFTQGRAKGSGWQSSLQNLSATFAGVLKPALAGVASFLRGTVLPAASAVFGFLGRHETTVRVIAGVIATVLTPAIVAWGVKSTISAAKSVTAWTTSTLAASGGAIKQVVSAGRVVAGWVLMGVQSMIRAAQMAAAWVIAMGPVGWIITAVVALVALIILNWDRVKGWTIAAWHAIIGAIKGAWNAIIGAIKTAWNWILGVIKGAWNWVVNATKTAWNAVIGAVKTAWQWLGNTVRNGISAVVEFVKGLPGRILRGLGRIGSLLLNVGKDLLSGLWNGIKSAGHWLLEKVGQFFGDLLPGWIRDILGISSPSTMFAAFGRDSMRGFAAGIDAGAGTALAAARRATLAVAGAGSGSLGFSAPGYDMGGAGGGMGGRTYVTTVSGVASPEAVAAVVDRAQRTNEFLAGVGS